MNFFKELKKNLPYLAVLFGVFAFLLISCPAVSIKESLTCFSGATVAFGKFDSISDYLVIAPSAMVLTYFLLLGAIACMVLSIVFPKYKTLFSLLSGGLFFLAMILFFCSKAFLNIYVEDYWGSSKAWKKEFKKECSLGAGAILSAVFCLFACVSALFNIVFDTAKSLMQEQVNKAAQAQLAATAEPVAPEAPVASAAPVEEVAAEPVEAPIDAE